LANFALLEFIQIDTSSHSHGASKVLKVYWRKTKKRDKGELASEGENEWVSIYVGKVCYGGSTIGYSVCWEETVDSLWVKWDAHLT
jgi:hypothetical protein